MTVTITQLLITSGLSIGIGIMLTLMAQEVIKDWIKGSPTREVNTFEIVTVIQSCDSDQEDETSYLYPTLAHADHAYEDLAEELRLQTGEGLVNWYTIDLTRIIDGEVMQEDAG